MARLLQLRRNRRNFLKVGSAGLLGMSLADRLAGGARAETVSTVLRPAQNCIVVWLAGGPATIDMWDMKPEAPAEIRGEFRPIATSVTSLSICEHLPEIAKVMDRCCLVRSVAHALADHDPGTELVITGHVPTPALSYPSVGAIASKLLHERPGVPKFIALGDRVPGGSGFLGAPGSSFNIRRNDLMGRENVSAPVELPDGFSVTDLDRRESLLKKLDNQFVEADQVPVMKDLSSFQQQALDILRSNKTRSALDLQTEPEKTRDLYGNGWAGRALLAARRLVEAGVGFVTASIDGWDTHGNNFGQLRSNLLPQLDRALAALIQDLDSRGLLQSTIVYCAGEFGRTPFINAQAGRDHWARAMSVLLAGGGLQRGQIHGATDARGMEPISGACSPADINATLLHLLGISSKATLMTPSGRPIAAHGDGTVVKELF